MQSYPDIGFLLTTKAVVFPSYLAKSDNEKDKQLLYLKYYENKTDYQLSLIFGVTQQSITERKNRILKKLKNRFRI